MATCMCTGNCRKYGSCSGRPPQLTMTLTPGSYLFIQVCKKCYMKKDKKNCPECNGTGFVNGNTGFIYGN